MCNINYKTIKDNEVQLCLSELVSILQNRINILQAYIQHDLIDRCVNIREDHYPKEIHDMLNKINEIMFLLYEWQDYNNKNFENGSITYFPNWSSKLYEKSSSWMKGE